MEWLGPVLCNGGSPTFSLLYLKGSDPEYKTKLFTPFNGWFHTILESHHLCGHMFEPYHLRKIWQVWHPTPAQLDWIMNPRDPNQ
eukprot:14044530-Ditylum_brightwellii.AAC.1